MNQLANSIIPSIKINAFRALPSNAITSRRLFCFGTNCSRLARTYIVREETRAWRTISRAISTIDRGKSGVDDPSINLSPNNCDDSAVELEGIRFNRYKKDNILGGDSKINIIKSRILEKEMSVMKQSTDDVVYGGYKYSLINDKQGYATVYRSSLNKDSDPGSLGTMTGEERKINRKRELINEDKELVIDMASLARYYSPPGGVELLSMKPCNGNSNIIAFMTRTIEFPYTPKLWIKFLDSRVCVEINLDSTSLEDLNDHCLHDFEWMPSETSRTNQGINDCKITSLTMYFLYRDFQSDRTDIVCEYTLDTNDSKFKSKVKRLLSTSPASYHYLSSSTSKPTSASSVTLYSKVDISKNDIAIIHKEQSEAFHLNLSTSKDKTSTFIHSQSKTCTEVYLLDKRNNSIDRSKSNLVLLAPKLPNVRTYIDMVDGNFYITSNRYSATGDLEIFKVSVRSGLSFSNENKDGRCGGNTGAGVTIDCAFNENDRIWPMKQPVSSIDSSGMNNRENNSNFSTEEITNRRLLLSEFDVMRLGIVIYGSRNGKPYIDLVRHQSYSGDGLKSLESSAIGESITARICSIVGSDIFNIYPSINSDINSKFVSISVSNPLLPEARIQIDLISGEVNLISYITAKWSDGIENGNKNSKERTKAASLLSLSGIKKVLGLDAEKSSSRNDIRSRCKIERHYISSSRDSNVHIPLTVVTPLHSPSLPINSKDLQSRPVLLVGYGAYGSSLSISYLSEHHELLERGWALAFAHTRGGGEMGSLWHRAGKLDQKWNSIHDLVDCSTFLKNKSSELESKGIKTTSVFGKGCSAGGILFGASAARFGRNFDAIIMRSPFLNVLGVMRDPSLPLTEHEYDEWGKVVDEDGREDPRVVEYIKSYSPIDLVEKDIEDLSQNEVSVCRHYPGIMISVGLQDTRVNPYESLTFADGMRRLQASAPSAARSVCLVRIWPVGGHDGPDSLEDQAIMKAEEIAFLEAEYEKAKELAEKPF